MNESHTPSDEEVHSLVPRPRQIIIHDDSKIIFHEGITGTRTITLVVMVVAGDLRHTVRLVVCSACWCRQGFTAKCT